MNEPPDQTAVLSAENLLSAGGMTVPKYSLNRSGWSRSAESVSVKMTPFAVSSFCSELYTTSDSYCAETPARNFRSASGTPRRSYVFLMSGGRSSHVGDCLSDALRE